MLTPAVRRTGHFGQTWFARLPEVEALDSYCVCVDAGAYVGDTAEPMLARGAKVVCYEPQPDAVACLIHNCPEAFVRPVALGDGQQLFRHGGGAGNMGARWTRAGSGRIPVESVRLDDEGLERLDLLKIDVEGMEPLVLRGAQETIRELRPIVVVELNPKALKRAGFLPHHVTELLPGYDYRVVHRTATHDDWLLTPRVEAPVVR